MELKSDTLHNLIDLEIDHINFLLDLIYSNKTLTLSLINTFISTAELQSSSSDLEFFNKMILELQVALADNIELQNDLVEIKAMFEKITSRLDKNTLVSAIDAFKEKQEEIHRIELKLHSYTPRLLNQINRNIMTLKSKDLRKEISKVIPSTPIGEDTNDNNTNNNNDSEKNEEEKIEKEVVELVETIKSDAGESETGENVHVVETNNEIEEIESTEDVVDNAIKEIVNENKTTAESTEIASEVIPNTTPVEEANSNSVIDKVEKIEKTDENIENVNENVVEKDIPSKDSLIISEITGEVTLPFTHTVVSIDEFKNPVSSRFREGYRLSRERENEGTLISISVGLKLCFKSKIHPAIIRACRDFDDLDTYLFYLDNNQADYFPNFKILYKSYPVKNYIKN